MPNEVIFLLILTAAFSILWASRIKLLDLYFKVVRLNIRRKYVLSDCKLKIDGVEWSYLRGGSGAPIILLPGLGANKYQWGPKIYDLVNCGDLIILDLPSAGDSIFAGGQDFDPAVQVDHLGKLISNLNLRDITIVGASIGGLVAGMAALKFSKAIGRTVLISPAGLSGSKVSDALSVFMETGVHPFGYETVEQLNGLYRMLFKSQPKIPIPLKKYLALKNKKEIKRRLLALNAVKPYLLNGLNEFVKNNQGPLLLVWGAFDLLFDKSIAEELAERGSGITVSLVQSGHLPYLETPQCTYDLIRSFIESKKLPINFKKC
jgi:abhydrolase domain-containing protein 6